LNHPEHGNLLAAWNWFVARDDLDAVRTMILGLSWIAYRQGWGRAFMQLLEACALKLKEGAAARAHVPDRDDERALVQATILAARLDGAYLVSRKSWDAWIKEAMSLLAQGETDAERWREVHWLLRYRLAKGHHTWGNYAEAVALFRLLLPELDEGRFRPWPYTDDARYLWQIVGRWWLGQSRLCLGEYEEAQRLAEQNIALAEQIGAEGLRWECDGLRAEALIYAGDCRQAEKDTRELLRAFRGVGFSTGTAWAFFMLGGALAGLGSYVRARACFRRALAFAREAGEFLVASLHHLGNVELALGNLAEARWYYRELISLCEGRGLSFGVVASLTGLARLALVTGDLVAAREHLLRALKLQPHSRPIEHTIDAIAVMSELLQAEGQWEPAAELCAALLSWPATPQYSPSIVQHLRAELEARLRKLEVQLQPEVFAAATARGRARQVDEVVAELIGGPPDPPSTETPRI
jgi:tetratricopeptide (TPR) repeat protein